MFEIIIKQHVTKTIVKQSYGVVEKRPYTDEELKESNTYWQSNDDMKKQIKEVMGYRPPIETEEQEERTIYRQEVDELDLAAVIIAVNKLLDLK